MITRPPITAPMMMPMFDFDPEEADDIEDGGVRKGGEEGEELE